jgi:hypothetical protein
VKACQFCRGRATKLVSLSNGLITCQQCQSIYESEGVKEAVSSLLAKVSAEFEHRILYGVGRDTPSGLVSQLMTVVCSRRCLSPRRDKDQEHPGVCVCGGYLTDEPAVSATYDSRGVCSISTRCLFAGCFYPLGDMCVFCFKVRPMAPPTLSPLEKFKT